MDKILASFVQFLAIPEYLVCSNMIGYWSGRELVTWPVSEFDKHFLHLDWLTIGNDQ